MALLSSVRGEFELKDCPACWFGGSASRRTLVARIVDLVRRKGGFQVSGVESFWSQFRDSLCDSCRRDLDSIESQRREAVRLLEEAVRVDKNNKTAKQNLETARKMV